MDSVLGRKQRIKNSDWIETFDKIEQLITKKELDQLVDKTIQDIKAKTKGKSKGDDANGDPPDDKKEIGLDDAADTAVDES